MKSVGIIGGIAPESTIDYYRQIIALYRERTNGGYPSIVINSVDLSKILGFVAANQFEALIEYLIAGIERLAQARADFGLLASNTPHIVFDEVRRRSPIPLISIVEAAAGAAKVLHFTRLGLLGTRFTMQAPFYREVFSRAGIAVVTPAEDEQNYVHGKYVGELVNNSYTGELVNGIFLPETRQGLLEIVRRMVERDRIEGLILGGTELPLILRDEGDAGIPFLDTTRIHVQSVVAELLA